MEVIARYDPDMFAVFDAVINTNNYGKLTPQRVRDLFASVLASRVHDGYISFRTARGILDNVSHKAMGGFATRGFRAVGGAMTAYLQALKKWNDKPDRWCSPRKGTPAHAEVMKLQKQITHPITANLTDADFEGVKITDEEIASYIQEKYPALELTLAEIEQYIDEFDPKVFGDIRESDLAKVVIDDEEIARYLADVEANVKNARELLLGLSPEDLEGVEITDAEIAEYVDELDKIDAKIAEAKAPRKPRAKAPRKPRAKAPATPKAKQATPRAKAKKKPATVSDDDVIDEEDDDPEDFARWLERGSKLTPEEEARAKAEIDSGFGEVKSPATPKAKQATPKPADTPKSNGNDGLPKIYPVQLQFYPKVEKTDVFKEVLFNGENLLKVSEPRGVVPRGSNEESFIVAENLKDRADAILADTSDKSFSQRARVMLDWLDNYEYADIFPHHAPTWKKFNLVGLKGKIKDKLDAMSITSNLQRNADTPDPQYRPDTAIPYINFSNYREPQRLDWIPEQEYDDFYEASTGLEWLQRTKDEIEPVKMLQALDYYNAVFKSLLGDDFTRGLNIPLWLQRVKYLKDEKIAEYKRDGVDYPTKTELPKFAIKEAIERAEDIADDYVEIIEFPEDATVAEARAIITPLFRRIWRVAQIYSDPFINKLYDEIAKANKYIRPHMMQEFESWLGRAPTLTSRRLKNFDRNAHRNEDHLKTKYIGEYPRKW